MQSLMELGEDLSAGRKRNVVSLADKYFKKYKKQMEVLESHSLVSRVRPITE